MGSPAAADGSPSEPAPLPAGQAARKEAAPLGSGSSQAERLIPVALQWVPPSLPDPRDPTVPFQGTSSTARLSDAESNEQWERRSRPRVSRPSFGRDGKGKDQHAALARLSTAAPLGAGPGGRGRERGREAFGMLERCRCEGARQEPAQGIPGLSASTGEAARAAPGFLGGLGSSSEAAGPEPRAVALSQRSQAPARAGTGGSICSQAWHPSPSGSQRLWAPIFAAGGIIQYTSPTETPRSSAQSTRELLCQAGGCRSVARAQRPRCGTAGERRKPPVEQSARLLRPERPFPNRTRPRDSCRVPQAPSGDGTPGLAAHLVCRLRRSRSITGPRPGAPSTGVPCRSVSPTAGSNISYPQLLFFFSPGQQDAQNRSFCDRTIPCRQPKSSGKAPGQRGAARGRSGGCLQPPSHHSSVTGRDQPLRAASEGNASARLSQRAW